MIIEGDEIPPGENAVIIANHQVDIDWWYIWSFANLYQRHGDVRIGLRADMKHIPIFGWGMYFFDFLFISRAWEKDQMTMTKKFSSWIEAGIPLWFVIFPEGTTIYESQMQKSKDYALTQKRQPLEHLLLPRTTGLQLAVKLLNPSVSVVYDVTIGYPSYSGEIPTYEMGYTRRKDIEIPSFLSVLLGKPPGVIRVHVKRRVINKEIIENNFVQWVDDVWKEKDQRLTQFINNGNTSFLLPGGH